MIKAAEGDPRRLRRISRLAVLTFLFTLLAACWWGQALLDLFAITLDSFRVAGGDAAASADGRTAGEGDQPPDGLAAQCHRRADAGE